MSPLNQTFYGQENKGGDHQLKKLLIVNHILFANTLWNVYRTVWIMCMPMLGCKVQSAKLSYLEAVWAVYFSWRTNQLDGCSLTSDQTKNRQQGLPRTLHTVIWLCSAWFQSRSPPKKQHLYRLRHPYCSLRLPLSCQHVRLSNKDSDLPRNNTTMSAPLWFRYRILRYK